MAKHSEKGSLIVAALLMFAILLTLGLGLMSAQASRMRAAKAQALSIQARALALAGWEDVRLKLGKDILFPNVSDAQTAFSYSEDVYDLDGKYIGNYSVKIDTRWESVVLGPDSSGALPNPTDPAGHEAIVNVPESIYPITVIGKVAEQRVGEIFAERVLYIEFDVVNWRVIRFEDRGSL